MRWRGERRREGGGGVKGQVTVNFALSIMKDCKGRGRREGGEEGRKRGKGKKGKRGGG